MATNRQPPPRLNRAQRKELRVEVKAQDALVPGAWSFWRAGWRLLLASPRTLIAMAIVIAIDIAVFATNLGTDVALLGTASNALAWLVVTIAVLRTPVHGLPQLLATAGACVAIVALQLLPGRMQIGGALVGAFLGAAPGLLWRGASMLDALRHSAVLLVRRLAGAVSVFIALVLLPMALVAAVASALGHGTPSDFEHAGRVFVTLYAVLMVVSIGPMYAAMAHWLFVVEPTRSGLPTVDRDPFTVDGVDLARRA
ncbi:MAG: hypothetical protein H7287_03660 [Thermoleophilia bacterium]|nr:hypothetical protein [Thermoleophilia bacterium]